MEIIRRNGDYALRALVSLARQKEAGELTTIATIAQGEKVPIEFLRKVFLKLARAGIVRSRRGVGGGYELAQPVEGVTVLDIVRAVQGPVTLNRCQTSSSARTGARRCSRRARCPVRPHLEAAQESLEASLSGITLKSLAAEAVEARETRP